VDFSLSRGPAGDFKLTAGSIEGSGTYFLGSNQLTVGGNSLSTTVDGSIRDGGNAVTAVGGSLVKVGSGTLTLAGVNAYTGSTAVNGGILLVTGDNSSSAMTTVNTGGTLGGAGTVGNTTVAGGTFAPGDGTPGTSIKVGGNLVFQSAATYLVQINSATASFANVTGAATLGGVTVSAVFAPGSFVAKRYTILTAAGGVTGTFGSVVSTNLPSNNLRATLSYDATMPIFAWPSTLTFFHSTLRFPVRSTVIRLASATR
jgi:autotransporter-associated beta strand protein